MNQIAITVSNQLRYVSLWQDNHMRDLLVERTDIQSDLGHIYVAKVKNIVENVNAAFLEYQPGKNCYFPLKEQTKLIPLSGEENEKKLVAGDNVLIQISKEDVKSKLPSSSAKISLSSKYCVLTHGNLQISISSKITEEEERNRLQSIANPYSNEDYGFIIRTNALGVSKEDIETDIDRLIAKYESIQIKAKHSVCFKEVGCNPNNYLTYIRDMNELPLDRVITDVDSVYDDLLQLGGNIPLVHYKDDMLSLTNLLGFGHELQRFTAKKVWLKSGASLVIEPTEALTSIDVNTEKAIAGKRNPETTFFNINKEAAKEIARQLRCRNLSGIIIVDFIDMKKEEHRQELLSLLRGLLKADPVKTILIDMTKLGLVEITRRKTRRPLHEMLRNSEK